MNSSPAPAANPLLPRRYRPVAVLVSDAKRERRLIVLLIDEASALWKWLGGCALRPPDMRERRVPWEDRGQRIRGAVVLGEQRARGGVLLRVVQRLADA